MKKLLRVALIIGVLVVSIGAAGAQAIDPALLETIATAMENTRASTSLHVTAQSLTESVGTDRSLSSQRTQDFDFAKTETGWDMEGTVTYALSLPLGEFRISGEIIAVGGITYVRAGDAPADLPLNLPTTWVNLEEYNAESPNGGLPIAASAEGLLAALMIPINAESVTAIAALPDDEIDGQTMQVYQITIDSAAVLESEAASLFDIRMGGGGAVPAGGLRPPQGAPELPAAPTELETPSPEDIQMTFAIYIGADDGLVHRVYAVVNIAPSGEGANLTSTTITDYANFNAAVEITAPELGS